MVPDYGKVWYGDKSIENISSLTNFLKKYKFTYESHQYYALAVQTNIGITNFRRNKQGVYVFKPTYTTEK